MLARKSIDVGAQMPDLAYRPFSFLKQFPERARPGIQYKAIKHIERHFAVTLWGHIDQGFERAIRAVRGLKIFAESEGSAALRVSNTQPGLAVFT
jgi:hypothetical protein